MMYELHSFSSNKIRYYTTHKDVYDYVLNVIDDALFDRWQNYNYEQLKKNLIDEIINMNLRVAHVVNKTVRFPSEEYLRDGLVFSRNTDLIFFGCKQVNMIYLTSKLVYSQTYAHTYLHEIL